MMINKKENKAVANSINRRNFLKSGVVLYGIAGTISSGTAALAEKITVLPTTRNNDGDVTANTAGGELLYNGIQLPEVWPPQYMMPDSYDPMPVPYLALPPKVILVDVGRQLFVDDFLIEYTNLDRKFHRPVKQINNPLLKPETAIEMDKGYCPMAAPFSDGCFYDPKDKLFKLWYMAGWFDGTAYATSVDGIHWKRQEQDIVTGTNLVLRQENIHRDGCSVWLDHETQDPKERFKMYIYERTGEFGGPLKRIGGFLLTSPDGIHWKRGEKIASLNDNNTFFYNPFRRKWVFTIRRQGRPVPPWANPLSTDSGRARSYWENGDFNAALNNWDGAVFWFGADRLDKRRQNYAIGEEPQIYKVDAAGYESLMIGLIQLHYGPNNETCAKGGYPKLTELQIAFSRDGFHWDRSCRETFIAGQPHKKDSWERGYIHSIGGVCNIVGDKLHFYYTAFKGDEKNLNILPVWNGMYANASMGLAVLRRDGFASMEANESEKEDGILLTKPIQFSGKYLFVNLDAKSGALQAELCDVKGRPIKGFTRLDCMPVNGDSTRKKVTWRDKQDINVLANQPVRLKFYITNAKFYSFWISQNESGTSGGATAGGGPSLKGTWDV